MALLTLEVVAVDNRRKEAPSITKGRNLYISDYADTLKSKVFIKCSKNTIKYPIVYF